MAWGLVRLCRSLRSHPTLTLPCKQGGGDTCSQASRYALKLVPLRLARHQH